MSYRFASLRLLQVLLSTCGCALWVSWVHGQPPPAVPAGEQLIRERFASDIRPLLNKYCLRCHNPDEMKSGIRVDRLNGHLADRQQFLWKNIQSQLADQAMPPEDEPQPTAAERKLLEDWIREALVTALRRPSEKNGGVRRLTVAQYRNTLQDLLGIEDDLTDILPADAVSKDGFLNNQETMLLSPLLVEAYFRIAERALELCLVDTSQPPTIQKFRMDLGAGVNKDPFPERLILGANSQLLANRDFVVTQPRPNKPFPFRPLTMRTQFRFVEGYQGNSTVRGWRDYDSIYHAVFACMRGTPGYPKGLAYETVPAGLLLRPAIPSAELFQVESTYGPKANFKISLRELPDQGRFRVTVQAAKYDDALLLDPKTPSRLAGNAQAVTWRATPEARSVTIPQAGIYQVDVHLGAQATVKPDASRLDAGLIGAWPLNGEAAGVVASGERSAGLQGELVGAAKFVDSPFGQAIHCDGATGAVVVPRTDAMNVGEGDFTVAAWIHPRGLRQAGIVALGGYGYTHGWVFDMPAGNGVLRMETADENNQSNGTVQSAPGVITNNRWQHVAAVVQRGEGKTRLYVNGLQVATGTIHPANLDNAKLAMHIGRIPQANLFRGEIDEVRFYRRALDVAEIKALVEPGSQFVQPPAAEKGKRLKLTLGERVVSGKHMQPAFVAVRLPEGTLPVQTEYQGKASIHRIVFTRLPASDPLSARYARFSQRAPRLGVHVGLRRDCGSTLAPVGASQAVSSTELRDYIFEGAIGNFPSPDVEKDNVNYLAGVREIGVRSEYTDGRDISRLHIRSVTFEGPYYEQWPPAPHRAILIPSAHPKNSRAYAVEVIEQFATRAFRRPITEAESASLLAVWDDAFAATGDFQSSIKDTLLVVLTSPQFLFLIEQSDTPQPEPLAPFELASKLSYLLWNSAPDQQLLQIAGKQQLRERLDEQVGRMVQDSRFHRFTTEFASQWLSLDKFDVVEIDRQRFPRLRRDTKTQLRQEPVFFLEHLLRNNLPLRTLVQADFIVANEVVADYYGLGDRTESGLAFVPIQHEQAHLGGLLSQAAILAGLSNGREANPVKRGAWLARKIIAEPPDDPPPNVPALPEEANHELSLREQLERHRNQEGCAKCHAGIDPWGLPLEQYDAGGLFLKTKDVDARSTLPDETEILDANALKAYLAEERIDQVALSFLKHFATYATGRPLTYNEIEFLKRSRVQWKADGYRLQDLMRFVIRSDIFLEK